MCVCMCMYACGCVPLQSASSSVYVSFYQCVWSLHIVCSGSAKEAAIGNVNGGDVVRFIHRFWGGGDSLVVQTRKSSSDVAVKLPPCGSSEYVSWEVTKI